MVYFSRCFVHRPRLRDNSLRSSQRRHSPGAARSRKFPAGKPGFHLAIFIAPCENSGMSMLTGTGKTEPPMARACGASPRRIRPGRGDHCRKSEKSGSGRASSSVWFPISNMDLFDPTNVGHAGRPFPAGVPVRANRTTVSASRFANRRSSAVQDRGSTARLSNMYWTSTPWPAPQPQEQGVGGSAGRCAK